ncbi:MerR family transcriptional regulator [Saccharibacillus sp. CPCC 101409]|uniref:MerR family transcriptional regulator n=1 Tax=Saccharibacillus sp. CPCC 101409 TaxID=3058041 RepID=UPI0026717EC4|nr:MerR family transcriptional regulator [Saccharibacillus sp. CPCC 101409]MDO3411957.1 MerR family transcriptional regulator [Saccharibacillus sp. CPCC 101409]
MSFKVKEVSKLAGVSVRTLHHYDEIGLLKPAQVGESGYRFYSEEDLERLQQILFFRELGFGLKEIKRMMDSPSFDRIEALELQRRMLEEKLEQTRSMIENIGRTIRHARGEIQMTQKQRFEGMDFTHNPYEQEARERWGDAAVDDANRRLEQRTQTPEMRADLQEEWDRRMNEMAQARHEDPASPRAQKLIGGWYDYLQTFGSYSHEAFAGLGRMYVQDERFTQNIDRCGEGLAAWMSEAMTIFSERKPG